MIAVVTKFRVNGDAATDVRRALEAAARVPETSTGLLGWDVFVDRADPSLLVVVTRWTDFAAFEGWRACRRELGSPVAIPDGMAFDAASVSITVLDHVGALDSARTVMQAARPDSDDEAVRLRDELFAANNELVVLTRELAKSKAMLEDALEQLETTYWHLEKVQDVLPLCAACGDVKTARADDGSATWERITAFLKRNDLLVSHGYCPKCAEALVRESAPQ